MKENNLLLRGSTLKNVDFAYAVVLYTGQETKIMMNSVSSVGKLSSNDKLGVKIVLYCGLSMITLSLLAALYYLIMVEKFYEEDTTQVMVFIK